METYYATPETLSSLTPRWLEKIDPFNQHVLTLNREKSTLLVIDMQDFFLDPKSPSFTCGALAILPVLQKLIKTFREHNRPVIYTRHVHRAIAPLPSEKVILKHRYSAFYNTDLETILRVLKIEDLVITGVMTNMCCESTARDAYFRDYRVFFPADGNGSITEEMHLATLLNLAFGFAYVTSSDKIIQDFQ